MLRSWGVGCPLQSITLHDLLATLKVLFPHIKGSSYRGKRREGKSKSEILRVSDTFSRGRASPKSLGFRTPSRASPSSPFQGEEEVLRVSDTFSSKSFFPLKRGRGSPSSPWKGFPLKRGRASPKSLGFRTPSSLLWAFHALLEGCLFLLEGCLLLEGFLGVMRRLIFDVILSLERDRVKWVI